MENNTYGWMDMISYLFIYLQNHSPVENFLTIATPWCLFGGWMDMHNIPSNDIWMDMNIPTHLVDGWMNGWLDGWMDG